MTNNLKEKIEYFLDLRGKITQGEWGDLYPYTSMYGKNEISLNGNIESFKRILATGHDLEAMSKIPQALDLIAELQKRLDDYEARVQRLTEYASGRFTSDQSQDMAEYCLEIMTGEYEG